jgi:predicted nucleic acid-binding protein
MAVVFDSSILLLILQPSARPPIDPQTNLPLAHAAERTNYLVRKLSAQKTSVLIPTPVLTEILCGAEAAKSEFIRLLSAAPFQIAPFDTRASIDCAELLNTKLSKKRSAKIEPVSGYRAKIKFDQQIVAIAKVHGVDAIYSDDKDILHDAKRVSLTVIRSFELERDPSTIQGKLDIDQKL